MRFDVDLAIPRTDREVFVRVHKDRGFEWGVRQR